MNYAPARIQRLTRELSDELCQEYGVEHAARALEAAANTIRTMDDARTAPTARDELHVDRGPSSRV